MAQDKAFYQRMEKLSDYLVAICRSEIEEYNEHTPIDSVHDQDGWWSDIRATIDRVIRNKTQDLAFVLYVEVGKIYHEDAERFYDGFNKKIPVHEEETYSLNIGIASTEDLDLESRSPFSQELSDDEIVHLEKRTFICSFWFNGTAHAEVYQQVEKCQLPSQWGDWTDSVYTAVCLAAD